MKPKRPNLSDALFPKVRQQVLGLLFNYPGARFHTNEIIRLSGSGTGAVQRELEKLTHAGLITVELVGKQKQYQANQASLLFNELHSIVLKTFGLADILRHALEPVRRKIKSAFIYGSIAKNTDTANSDIDLMLITDKLTYAEIFPLLETPQQKLNRAIHPTFYSTKEWASKLKKKNHFVTQVVKQPKIFLLGDESELKQLGQLD